MRKASLWHDATMVAVLWYRHQPYSTEIYRNELLKHASNERHIYEITNHFWRQKSLRLYVFLISMYISIAKHHYVQDTCMTGDDKVRFLVEYNTGFWSGSVRDSYYNCPAINIFADVYLYNDVEIYCRILGLISNIISLLQLLVLWPDLMIDVLYCIQFCKKILQNAFGATKLTYYSHLAEMKYV